MPEHPRSDFVTPVAANQRRPQVLYVLSHPFSGSTLFSIVLGAQEGLVNLGEVSFLANDYKSTTLCLCGQGLEECPYWQELVRQLENDQAHLPEDQRFHLNDQASLSEPDLRGKGIFLRLKLSLGFPLDRAFPEEKLRQYSEQHLALFRVFQRIHGDHWLIDCSKSPHRLEILSKDPEIELKVVWLRRGMKSLLASKIKREKRRKRYLPLLSVMTNIAWLLAYQAASRRAYDQIEPGARVEINLEDFLLRPDLAQASISRLLGVDESSLDLCRDIWSLEDAHLYVGNRWLFEHRPGREVAIRRKIESPEFSRLDEVIINLAAAIFPDLRS